MKTRRIISFFLALALAAGLLTATAFAAEPPEVTAKAALLVDVTYGEDVLFQQNVHDQLYPAGITNVMTGLLVLEAVERGELSLEQPVTVSQNAKQGLSWNVVNAELKPGEIISVDALLRCALIAGHLDACNVLAEATAGSIEAFVQRMNDRAAELGCENTHFTNPHGLHDDQHYTTAWDLYLICRKAMEYKDFRQIVSAASDTVPATNLHSPRSLYNSNALLSGWRYEQGYRYQYATGIRTGYTEEAGRCLAASATHPKSDRSLICIVLGCQRTPGATDYDGYREFSEGRALLEWGFNSFSRRAVLTTTDLQGDVPVTLSKTQWVAAQPAGAIEATLSKDVPDSDIRYDIRWDTESVAAPVKKGQKLGTISVSYGDLDFGTVDLVAVADVERSQLLYLLDLVGQFFAQTWVKIVLITFAVLFLLLVLWAVFFRKRARSRSRNSHSSGRSTSSRPRSSYRSGKPRPRR